MLYWGCTKELANKKVLIEPAAYTLPTAIMDLTPQMSRNDCKHAKTYVFM